MNRIAGKVLTENSRVGIADLIVLAIDYDADRLLAQNPDRSLDLSQLLDASREEWAPQRLGSVITDQQGRFELEFKDDLFRQNVQTPERRPDIILYVQVPDRPARGGPAGLSSEQRVIFHTRPIRFEAGRMESFVILLGEEQLAQYGYRMEPVPSEPAALSPQYLDELIHAEQSRIKKLGAVRAERMVEQNRRLEQERTIAPNLMERLARGTGLPMKDFLSPGFEPAKIPEIILDGITEMLDLFPEDDESLSTLVYLTDKDIRALRREEHREEHLAVGEELETTLCDVLAQTGSPDSLLRSRGLLTEVKARRAVRDLSVGPVPAKVQRTFPWMTQEMWFHLDDEGRAALLAQAEETLAEPEEGGPAGDGREEVTNAIFDRLAAQVSQLPQLKGVESGGAINELDRVKEVVNRLELAGGPANVVASRDVNVLQLAFKWVWTSLFDQDFEKQVRRLYDNVVKLKEERGISLSDLDDVSNADDLRRMLQDIRRAASVASDEPVPPSVNERFPFVTRDKWARLDEEGKQALIRLTTKIKIIAQQNAQGEAFVSVSRPGEEESNGIVETEAREILETHISPERNPIAGADELVTDLEKRLTEPYSFDVFAPGHVNYGVMLTYRQEWSPVTYQVGELVETLPLAPGETREFRVKSTTKERARRKTIESRLRESIRESEMTSRTETEALHKTSQAINNSIQTRGSFNIGIGQIGVTSQFSQNFTEESRRLQKTFQELTRKASDKVRREHEVTVETATETLLEETEKQTISNPNDEITVTYLMYELERRYQVASRLRQVQPVICVALDMPAPHEITEAWLIEHSWILGESLLDPDLEPLLDYLEEDRAGGLLELEVRRTALEEQRQRTAKLDDEFTELATLAKQRREAIVEYMEVYGVAKAKKSRSAWEKFGRWTKAAASFGASELGGDDGGGIKPAAIEAYKEAAEQALEYLDEQLEAKRQALTDAQEALAEATEKYSEAVKAHAAHLAAITRLQLHVRNNIYHYMHQIWSYQHADKRFFSLYDLEIPFFPPDETAYRLRIATSDDDVGPEVPSARSTGTPYVLEFRPPEPPGSYDEISKRKLGEVADVDRPLGFRGNYIIFPLRECCQLTDAMIYPYVDTYTGLRDPAYGRGYTGEELVEFAKEVWADLDEETERDPLERMIIEALIEYPNATQEVTLPTGQLFMEALKGDTALLEDFKLAHRGLDVMKVEEEVRARRIDALRRAGRIAGTSLTSTRQTWTSSSLLETATQT